MGSTVDGRRNGKGSHDWVEIMIPGMIVGLLVGYAKQEFERSAAAR